MRINVIGTSASGKSTFSRKLAQVLDVPYIEMDRLFWKPAWEKPTDEEFFANLQTALEQEHWVLDGNYSRTTPLKWPRTEAVIWLDYSFARTLYQAISRAIKRSISQEELWPGTGNIESFGRLFGRDSIVLWSIQSYHRNRRRYPLFFSQPGICTSESRADPLSAGG